jgi:hypothetical protein
MIVDGHAHIMRPHTYFDWIANAQVDLGNAGVSAAAHHHIRREGGNEWEEEI